MDFVFLGAYTFLMLQEIQIHRLSVEIRMNVKGYTPCDGPAGV
jgi:hypothetical protein